MPRRIVQTAYCCDRVFARRCLEWRYYKDPEARQWPGTPRHCPDCGCELAWRRRPAATASLRYYRRIRARRLAAGLTTRGTPRRRRAELSATDRRVYNLHKWRVRAERLERAGLTTRGTERQHSRLGRPSNPVERAWREMRSQMPEAPSGNWDDLTTIKERWE